MDIIPRTSSFHTSLYRPPSSPSLNITFSPSSLFQPPQDPSQTPATVSATSPGAAPCVARSRSRSCSRESSSSIDTEFTHFRPIRRHPVTPGKQILIARPSPVRTITTTTYSPSTDCTLSTLSLGTDQDREQARIKQEKMDCELAWKIHKQEKRTMLRKTSIIKQSPSRNKAKKGKDESSRKEMKKTVKAEAVTWQAQVRRQQTRRKGRRSEI